MIKLNEQLSGYKCFFSEFRAELLSSNDITAHKALSYVINTQFDNVKSPSCIKSIEKKLGQFVRDIQAEFEYMKIIFDDYYYSDFILDLAETEVRGYLSSYHLLIVRLLKLLVIVIKERDNENEVYEFVLDYDCTQLGPERLKVLFDEDNSHSETGESGVDEFTSNQLDIALKELF